MESLEAKVTNLKATFQDFANNVITKEFLSNLLDMANRFLEFVNTPFGQAATRIFLVSTALNGLYGILKSYAKFTNGTFFSKLFNLFGGKVDISSKLKGVKGILSEIVGLVSGKGLAAGGGLSSLLTKLGATAIPLLKVVGVLGVIVSLIAGLKKMYDATFPTVDSFNQSIAENNQQLESNKQRLEEINAMPWNEKTQAILDEKAALEAENEELRKNIELEEQRQLTAAKTALLGDEGSAAYVKGGTFLGGYEPTSGDATGSKESTSNIAAMREYINALQTEGQLTAQQNADLQELLPKLAERKAYYEVLKANYDKLNDAEKEQVDLLGAEITTYDQLVAKYDRAVYGQDALIEAYESMVSTGKLTEEQVNRLTNMYPELESRVVKTADGYVIQKDALYSLINAENLQVSQIGNLVNGFIAEQKQTGATKTELLNLVKAQIQASNTGLNFSQQIQALQQLTIAAGYTANYVNSVLGAGLSESNIRRTAAGYMQQPGNTLTYEQALAKARQAAQASLNQQWNKLTSTAPKFDWSASFGGGYTYSGTTTTADDAAEKARQAQIKALQKEKDAIQDAIDEINDSYEKQIEVIEKEQDAIQDTIDAINEKYDAQIDALEKVNDELEDEIELQQILEEMAKAKSTKKMVYKDGRFQYVEDLDAMAKAQAKLDEYNRKQAIKKEKADLEEQRQLELKAYEDRKKLLEQEKATLEERNKLDIESYNERKKLLEQQIKALQDYGDSYAGALGAIGDTIDAEMQRQIEMMRQRIAELQALLEQANSLNQQIINTSSTSSGWVAAPSYGSTSTGAAGNAADRGMSSGQTPSTPRYDYTGKTPSAGGIKGATNVASGLPSSSTKKTPLTKPGSGKGAQRRLAGGTTSSYGGLTLVGENGPELRVLNQGDGVLPANITRNLWAMATNPNLRFGRNGGSSNTAISVANVTLPNVRNAEEFVSGLKNMAYQRAYARA